MVSSLWMYEVEEMAKLFRAAKRSSVGRFRMRVAARRQLAARSTRPWRRRLARVGSPVWPEPSGWPDLISLYVGLSK